jgi:hypothetical protein
MGGVHMIKRHYYFKQIEKFIDQPVVKVITGIRRSGKSTLLKLIQEELLGSHIKTEQIIYMNFESMTYYDIQNAKDLYEDVMGKILPDQKMYLFFDEIQMITEWERAINSFLVDLNADIYITGSDSNLLSSELSTLLTGRYVEFTIYPLSYMEMLLFHEQLKENTASSNKQLWHYIRCGGFPTVHIAEYDDDAAYMLIHDIYDSIVLRDVVQRYKIRNIELLNRIMKFIMDNVGNTFSAKSISDFFKSQQRKVDPNTIYNYIAALESSFIILKVNRYDLLGKELLKTQEKFYLADPGIQHAIFGYRDRNLSGVLENIVFLELRRRGYQVYIGKLKEKEIDFVAEKKNEKIYIQVTYRMESEKTLSREFAPLLAIKDHYPKYVISMDDEFHDNIQGVRHIHLQEFLTSKTF